MTALRAKNFAPNDPEVKIPDAVKAAAAAADQIHADAYSTESPAPADDAPAETPAAPETPSELRISETPRAETFEPRAESKPSDDNWEHKYNSMKGRYERAQQQITQLSEQISSMQRVMASMQAQTAPRVESQELKAERLITPEEENDYGPDFLNVVGKKAKEELLPELRKYQEEIASLKAQLSGVGNYVAQDSLSRMQSHLDNAVPNWREQNVNPEFLDWLALPDPYSGDIRHNLLKAAWERHDAPRVAAFFRGFLAEEAATRPANSGDIPAGKAGKVPLESFAAPGRAKTAAASNAPAEKPIVTTAQIAKFYADVAAGRYNGRDEEKNRFERQIFEAQRDGRIR